MSGSVHDAAPSPGGRPAGLLEKLMAAIRPEFRAEVLTFEAADPVFGGQVCAVPGCHRVARCRQMCFGHHGRWRREGTPDLADFIATTPSDWNGRRQLASCKVPACQYASSSKGMCERHHAQWKRSGEAGHASWMASAAPLRPPSPVPPICAIVYCALWCKGRAPFCSGHNGYWRQCRSRMSMQEFTALYEADRSDQEWIDLRNLPAQLRLEVQYVLQSRRDEERARLIPRYVQRTVNALADVGAASFLQHDEEYWAAFGTPAGGQRLSGRRAFVLDSYLRIEALALGHGWDQEYPRDIWRLRTLGIDTDRVAALRFTGITQSWLKQLAKRVSRWRLTTGTGPGSVLQMVSALTHLSGFLASAQITSLAGTDRELLERYLAELHRQYGDRDVRARHIGALGTFLSALRQLKLADDLPATAMLFPEDYPRRPEPLPRAIAEQIMTQVEAPANLDRWDNPAYQLITLILIRCGLRITDAVRIGDDCIAFDADGSPYLHYYNHKMKRQALVPIDEELHALITAQLQRNLDRWPAGIPVLFPRPTANLDGAKPLSGRTYRGALRRWLERCEIRDEYGRPVHLTPHQWRHTLGTRLINRDVPQHVVQKILDHDSPGMTARYARLHDTTVRRHWENARKVNIAGDTVTLDPAGQVADAAWARQRLGRATQALPNGYCGLPTQQSCPHANSCLTCPMFITTAEFLPQHRAQHQQTLQIITAAEARGQTRLAEMNRQVAGNLHNIITSLEADPGDNADRPEGTANAG